MSHKKSIDIESYFMKVNKVPAIKTEKINIDTASSKEYYKHCLKSQLDDNIASNDNVSEFAESVIIATNDRVPAKKVEEAYNYVSENEEFEKDILIRQQSDEIKQIRRLYLKSLQNNFVKDMKIAHLEKSLRMAGIVETDPEPLLSATFSTHFMPEQLKILRSMDHNKRSDTTFVRLCLQYMYKDNLSALKCKSALGAPKRKVNKKDGVLVELAAAEPITPDKYVILQRIFADRISIIDIPELDKEERKKN